jgi:hypothetical protein
MPLDEWAKANFDTLQRAGRADDLALMECRRLTTGEEIPVVCAVQQVDGDETEFLPLAEMIADPYESLEPPDAGGGYREGDDEPEAEQEHPEVTPPRPKRKRRKIASITNCSGKCRECDWEGDHANALGLAVQHHDRTGHTVDAVQTLEITYGDPDKGDEPATPAPEPEKEKSDADDIPF